MPRPRHPIREHFTHVPSVDKKQGVISCNYCGREQSAGNPQRCQSHLDACAQYAQVLAALDAGETPSFPSQSPYESATTSASTGSTDVGGISAASAFPQTPPPSQNGRLHSPFVGNDRMTEDQIMHALHLDQDSYLAMERELDTQLMALNISGAGLLTQGGLSLLKQAFYQINSHPRWAEALSHVTEQEKTNAMSSMAYLVNRKRRNGHPPSLAQPKRYAPRKSLQSPLQQSTSSTPYTSPLTVPATREPSAPFGMTTIIAERVEPGGAFVICRPRDLLNEEKAPEDITSNDLKFMLFIDLLQHDEDVMFNALDDDKIVHTFTGGRTKTVSNEVVWRVALEEMHKRGSNPFVFKIYKRQRAGVA
ncbi:MAG: hypothetical protein Q9159_007282 [Coniocarpon cinnabarinum]